MNAATCKKMGIGRKHAESEDHKEYCCNAKKVEESLQDVAREAGRKMQSLMNSADEEVSSIVHSITTNIHKKPVQFGAVILGLGLLFGLLFQQSTVDKMKEKK